LILQRARSGASRATPGPLRYHQVYVGLRSWVRDGAYAPGQQIPTEKALCDTFGVSRITVRKAVDELVREGWLVREQGRGTFVAMFASRAAASIDLKDALHYVADLGAETRVTQARLIQIVPDEETRAALALGEAERVQRETHVRLLRGTPLGVITTYVPLDVAARINKIRRRSVPLFERLKHAGLRVGEAEQWIGATVAGVDEAQALHIRVGSPLLRVVRVVMSSARRPIERVVALYRADAYVYRLRIAPQRKAGRA
jgi:GntR family transcriptional regulator